MMASANSHAQRFYTGLSVSYGFPLASQNIPKNWGDLFVDVGSSWGTGVSLYTEAQQGSYGAGLSLKLHGGYCITKNISTELEVGYLLGRPYTLSRTDISNNYFAHESHRTRGNMLMLTPSIRYGVVKGRFFPFMRLGLVIGVLNLLNYEILGESQIGGLPMTESVSKYVFSGGAGIGVSFQVGTDFKITDHFSLSAALSVLGMSYSPSKGKWVKYDVNGENRLTTRSIREREVRFRSNPVLGGASVGDEPREHPKLFYPFSNAGLTLGFVYKLKFKKHVTD